VEWRNKKRKKLGKEGKEYDITYEKNSDEK
jgi:hypothetical protein